MFELVLRAPQSLVEPVSDLLMDGLDALSVSVEDADAGTEGERALFGEPGMPAPASGWDRSTLKALFESEATAERAATLLLAQAWADGLHLQSLAEMPEQDWVRLTQSQFAPVEITPEFWIVPSWHQPPPAARLAMRLDPGLAFVGSFLHMLLHGRIVVHLSRFLRNPFGRLVRSHHLGSRLRQSLRNGRPQRCTGFHVDQRFGRVEDFRATAATHPAVGHAQLIRHHPEDRVAGRAAGGESGAGHQFTASAAGRRALIRIQPSSWSATCTSRPGA